MTPKQTAIRNTMIVVVSGLATGVAVNLAFDYMNPAQIGTVICAVVLAFGIKMIYGIELDKAKSLEALNKTR